MHERHAHPRTALPNHLAGIPTYGISGMFRDPDGGGVHGLNERIRVRSLYEGHAFLDELVRALAR